MAWLKGFISDFFYLLIDIVFWTLDLILQFILLPIYWLFDGFLTIFTLVITSINLSSVGFETFAQWSSMPPQLIYIVNQLGLPQCVTIIVGAIIVRKIIDLIPGVATRF